MHRWCSFSALENPSSVDDLSHTHSIHSSSTFTINWFHKGNVSENFITRVPDAWVHNKYQTRKEMETFSIVNDFLSLILFQNLCLNHKFPPESFLNAIIFLVLLCYRVEKNKSQQERHKIRSQWGKFYAFWEKFDMNHNGNGIVDGKQNKTVKLWEAKEERKMDQITIKIKFTRKFSVRFKKNIFIYHKEIETFLFLLQLFFSFYAFGCKFIHSPWKPKEGTAKDEKNYSSLYTSLLIDPTLPIVHFSKKVGKMWESDLYKNYISRQLRWHDDFKRSSRRESKLYYWLHTFMKFFSIQFCRLFFFFSVFRMQIFVSPFLPLKILLSDRKSQCSRWKSAWKCVTDWQMLMKYSQFMKA